MRIPVLIVLAAGLGLGACDRAERPAPVGEPGPAVADEDDARSVTMRYDCGDGYSVAIMGDSARVTTPAGDRFDLPRMPDTSPPVYADEAMELAIGSEDAQLDRAEGGTLTCSPT
jgi:hypothetical protein